MCADLLCKSCNLANPVNHVNRPPPRSPRLRVSPLSILRFQVCLVTPLRSGCLVTAVAHPELHICLSLEPWRYRAGAIALVFAPTHVALRAAFGRLPSQRPLACVPVSSFRLPASSFQFPVSSFRLPVSGFQFPVSGFRFPVSGLPPSFPLMSPFGLPSAGYPASARWHVFQFPVSIERLGYLCSSSNVL